MVHLGHVAKRADPSCAWPLWWPDHHPRTGVGRRLGRRLLQRRRFWRRRLLRRGWQLWRWRLLQVVGRRAFMQLFSIDERAAIEDAISHAEKKTSGEIVVAQSTRS